MKEILLLIFFAAVILFVGLIDVSSNPYQFTPTVHFKTPGSFAWVYKQCEKELITADYEACFGSLGWHEGGLKIGGYYVRPRNWLVSLTTTPINDGKPFSYKVN